MIDAYTVESLPRMEKIARRCFRDFEYPGEFSWETFTKVWTPAIEGKFGVILRALEITPEGAVPGYNKSYNASLVGILGLMIAPDPFNGQTLCSVNFWYVIPEARHHGHGRELLKAAEAIAREAKCYRMLMGHPLGHTKFFQSEGFKPIEIGYHKVF